jgi:hypothetical protein
MRVGMTEQNPVDTKKKACGHSFNYCLVSKLIIAVPALPITAYMASMLFEDAAMKFVAAIASVVFVVYAAIKIDQIPALQKKIINKTK